MSFAPSSDTAIPEKFSRYLLPALICAGLTGNYFSFPLFLNIDFLFGSIFAMLALQFFGIGCGALSAFIIAGYTYTIWNHPYAIIIMTAEVAIVGWLMGRRKMSMVLADTLYWLIIGMPLVYLFYHAIMNVPLSNTCIVMVKQSVNGIANALAARLIFSCYRYQTRSSLLSFRELIYNILTFFVLCPALLMLAISSRKDFSDTDLRIRSALIQDSRHAVQSLETWVNGRKSAIVNLAELAVSRTPRQMMPYMELAKKSDANFLRIGLHDKKSITIAYSPLIDELGQTSIGKNFSDRPFMPLLKQTLKPMLSELVMGRIGIPRPRVHMLAPVVISGAYNGYVVGVLNLKEITEHLDRSSNHNATVYTLIDKNGAVIVTNRTDQTVMSQFVRGKGTLKRLDKEISQWMPDLLPNTPVSERWKKSYYVAETNFGGLSGWTLILEQPVAPFQKALYDNYTGKFTLLFLVLLGGLALAEFMSRKMMYTLETLRCFTSDLTAKLESGDNISWPQSGIKESHDLIDNFQKMSESVQHHVAELNGLNISLELLVDERTAKLSSTMQELNIILENAPIGIFKNIDRKLVWVNAKTTDLIQYSKGEIEHHSTRRYYPSDEDYEKLGSEAYPVLAQGAVFDTVQELVRKDGVHIKVKYTGKAIDPADMSKGSIWLLEDVTELRKLEEIQREAHFNLNVHKIELEMQNEELRRTQLDLESSRGRYLELYDLAPVGYFTLSKEGLIIESNFTFAALLEVEHAALLGQPITRYVFPDDQDACYLHHKQLLKATSPQSCELRLLRSGGGHVWCKLEAVVAKSQNNGDPEFRVAASDISEQKRLNDCVQQALKDTQKSNVTMSRLLHTVAHEFRTPLGLLIGSVDVLDRYWDRLTPEKRFEQNEHIRSAARQMSNLINSIISLNRTGDDCSGNESRLLNIKHICSAIGAEVEAAWGAGHTCMVTIADDCGSAVMDEMLFRRILENLLTNAFRYTPPEGTVTLDVSRLKGVLLIEVSDTGIGIPEEDQSQIFDAFYRSGNVEARRGLGLGLSIVQEALSVMGGTIAVVSRIGEGTVMRVEIPVAHPETITS